MLKIAMLTKRMDSCYTMRCLLPMSHMNALGHSVDSELLEQKFWCSTCAKNNTPAGPYEIQYDQEGDIWCPVCKSVIFSSDDNLRWKRSIDGLMEERDIIAFQRPTELAHLRLMKRAKDMGKTVVQSADDDYFNIPESNPGYRYYTERRGIVEETIRVCDAVDVTTPYLQRLYSDYCKNVAVLPNSLDIELIDVAPALKQFDAFSKDGSRLSADQFAEMKIGKKVILWGGSPTHEKDLEIIVGSVRRIARQENVIFAFVGYIHRAIMDVLPVDRLVLFSLVPHERYFMLYKGIGPDIGLAPVADVPFNHGKSALKAEEQMVLRSFPVMSDVVTYRGCSPRGIYAKNTDYDWYLAMKQAINMPEEERRIRTEENRRFVEAHRDIKKNIKNWIKFYEAL